MITRFEIAYSRADRLDNANPFMAKGPSRRNRRNIALEDMQVSAAYCGVQQTNNGVSRFIDDRGRLVGPVFNARTLIDEGFHSVFLYPIEHQDGAHVLDWRPSLRH